jgi:hypothetical protein
MSERSREEKKILDYLAVGASTPDSLRQFVGGTDAAFERAMTRLELEKEIRRGTWGALAVWRKALGIAETREASGEL